MPARPELLRRKLLAIEEAVGRLRSWMPVSLSDLETDPKLEWAIERGLHLAAEALFDAGNHLLAAEFQETADHYREIPTRLAGRGVLSAGTASRLQGLAGFRNVLVHEYADVDRSKVLAGLDRLADLEAFVDDVEGWLASAGR